LDAVARNTQAVDTWASITLLPVKTSKCNVRAWYTDDGWKDGGSLLAHRTQAKARAMTS